MSLIIITGIGEFAYASDWIDHSKADFDIWFPCKVGHLVSHLDVMDWAKKGLINDFKTEIRKGGITTILGPKRDLTGKKITTNASVSEILPFAAQTTATFDHNIYPYKTAGGIPFPNHVKYEVKYQLFDDLRISFNPTLFTTNKLPKDFIINISHHAFDTSKPKMEDQHYYQLKDLILIIQTYKIRVKLTAQNKLEVLGVVAPTDPKPNSKNGEIIEDISMVTTETTLVWAASRSCKDNIFKQE